MSNNFWYTSSHRRRHRQYCSSLTRPSCLQRLNVERDREGIEEKMHTSYIDGHESTLTVTGSRRFFPIFITVIYMFTTRVTFFILFQKPSTHLKAILYGEQKSNPLRSARVWQTEKSYYTDRAGTLQSNPRSENIPFLFCDGFFFFFNFNFFIVFYIPDVVR
jgi:hypothetical protein